MRGHILFDKNNLYMLVGENHDGDYVFDFNNNTHIFNLLKLIIKNDNKLKLWFEGEKRSSASRSFNNFYSTLENWLSKNNLSIECKVLGWEEDGVKYDKKDAVAAVTLGPSEGAVLDKLRPYLDGKSSLLDAIIKSKQFIHETGQTYTKQEYLNSLMDGNKSSKILDEITKPNTATYAMVKKVYRNDTTALRAKYFEGVPGEYKNSDVYKRIKRFNDARDVHLKNKLSMGGIFLAGDDHVPAVQKMLNFYSLG